MLSKSQIMTAVHFIKFAVFSSNLIEFTPTLLSLDLGNPTFMPFVKLSIEIFKYYYGFRNKY
jgi:hypothetical protein